MCFSSPAAAVGTYSWTSIGYSSPDAADTVNQEAESRDQPSHTALAWSDGPYSASAMGEAGFGYLRMQGAAQSVRPGNLGHFVNTAYSDTLTLSRADLAGRPGQVRVSFYYDHQLDVAATGSGQGNSYINWYAYGDNATAEVFEEYNMGAFIPGHRKSFYINDATGVSSGQAGFDEHYITLTVNFTWGQPLDVGFGLSSAGQAVDQGRYTIGAAPAGYWAGILEATADGVAIDDYDLTSVSGTDYSHSFVPTVPEPGSGVLLAAGLGILGAWRYRRPGTRHAFMRLFS